VFAGFDTAPVQASTNLEMSFLSVVPNVILSEKGYADINAVTHP